jgi:hypothetical protein
LPAVDSLQFPEGPDERFADHIDQSGERIFGFAGEEGS